MSDSEGTSSNTKKRKAENYEIFQRSKKVIRTPTKANEPDVTDICKQMLEEIKKIRKDQDEMKEKIEINNQEIKALGDEIKKTNEKWEKKYEDLESRFTTLERKVENMEKEKRKNNVVITGIEIDAKDEESKQLVEKWMEKELGVYRKIKEVIKITQDKMLVKMENFEDKMELLINKRKLKGKQIYIDNDLSPQERNIQRKLRLEAVKLREEGKSVKIRHMHIMVDGKRMTYNERDKNLKVDNTKN